MGLRVGLAGSAQGAWEGVLVAGRRPSNQQEMYTLLIQSIIRSRDKEEWKQIGTNPFRQPCDTEYLNGDLCVLHGAGNWNGAICSKEVEHQKGAVH